MAKLGDVCNFYSGTGFPNAYQGDKHGKYPFYKVGDISKNVISGNVELISCDNYINDDVVNLIKGTIIPPQCVVFAKIGEALKLNRRALTSCYCLVDNNVMGVQANNLYLDSRYFYYFMCNVDLQRYSESTAVPSVRKSRIAEIEIPLPSLEEQRHIAAILDKVTDLIAQRRAQLDKLDLLVKSRFVEMFGDPVSNPKGWPEENLQKNVQLLNGRAYKQEELLDSGKYPVLRVGNFFSNRNWYYSNLELEPDKYCDNGDLLYAWSASFGPQIWKGGKVIYHYHIWKVVIKDAYNKQFLCKLLEYVTASLMSETHGIAMMHLTKSGMEQTHFIVPPLELQEQFSLFVENVECIKSNIRRSLDKIVPLKSSLLFQYFKEA